MTTELAMSKTKVLSDYFLLSPSGQVFTIPEGDKKVITEYFGFTYCKFNSHNIITFVIRSIVGQIETQVVEIFKHLTTKKFLGCSTCNYFLAIIEAGKNNLDVL